jgi:hypothetical protein
MNDFMAREFWRFVVVRQEVAKLALTAIDYPPIQAPASFDLEAVKSQVQQDDEDARRAVGQRADLVSTTCRSAAQRVT